MLLVRGHPWYLIIVLPLSEDKVLSIFFLKTIERDENIKCTLKKKMNKTVRQQTVSLSARCLILSPRYHSYNFVRCFLIGALQTSIIKKSVIDNERHHYTWRIGIFIKTEEAATGPATRPSAASRGSRRGFESKM